MDRHAAAYKNFAWIAVRDAIQSAGYAAFLTVAAVALAGRRRFEFWVSDGKLRLRVLEMAGKREKFSIEADLVRIAALKAEGRWEDASLIVRKRLDVLLPMGPDRFKQMGYLEIVAFLEDRTFTWWVPSKKAALIVLLKEVGDYARWRDRKYGSSWYLIALHLLLEIRGRGEDLPYSHLLPSPEDLLAEIGDDRLKMNTRLALAKDFERVGNDAAAMNQYTAAMGESPQDESIQAICKAAKTRITGKKRTE
jgi:hypothetical protein